MGFSRNGILRRVPADETWRGSHSNVQENALTLNAISVRDFTVQDAASIRHNRKGTKRYSPFHSPHSSRPFSRICRLPSSASGKTAGFT